MQWPQHATLTQIHSVSYKAASLQQDEWQKTHVLTHNLIISVPEFTDQYQ